VIYPSEREISDFCANLPAAVKDEFAPLLERGQREYRRVWQLEPANEQKQIGVLCQFADAVFRSLAARRLRERAGDFDGFRAAISMDRGDAELSFWYAHRLYNLVERGRMLAIWHRQIESHLWDRIREAENLWYTPDIVPQGWESFLGDVVAHASGPAAPSDHHPDASPRGARKAPAEFFEAYRAKHPTATYDQIAARIGISRDSLFKIKDETAWVRAHAYAAAAGLLGCDADDLHPRNLPRRPRSKKRGQGGTPKTQT
jgi:hypothetical protein